MIILFFRLLSWITGILAIAAAITQWREPLLYPWPLVAFLVWYLLALSLLCFRRLSLRDALEKILPSVFVLISISLSFLLAEGAWEKWIVTGLFALIPFLVLELLFLLTFAPARYPVNGLSHVNVAFVPLGAFFLALAFDGLAVFLRIAPWMTLVAFMLFTAAAFYLTSHPTADHYHRRRWALLGGFVGLHVGLLSALLPLGMLVHGALASLFVGVPLRARRYAHPPKPSSRLAWSEGIVAFVLLIILLLASRWV